MVVDFELKKFSLGNLTKSFFQSSLGLILLNGGLAEKCVSLLIVSTGEGIFDLVVLRKKYLILSWLSDFELKKGSRQFNEKVFFNLVLDLLY